MRTLLRFVNAFTDLEGMLMRRNHKQSGAILFAVIGAKLSEGINFSDSLCRCVIVVSIPFPSTQSVELKERMKFVSELHHSQSASALDAGRLLCEYHFF